MALFFGIKQLDADGFLLLVPIVGPIGHQVDDDGGSDHWLRKVHLKCRRPRRLSHAARHVVVRQPRGRGFEKNLPFRELDYLSWSMVGTGRQRNLRAKSTASEVRDCSHLGSVLFKLCDAQ